MAQIDPSHACTKKSLYKTFCDKRLTYHTLDDQQPDIRSVCSGGIKGALGSTHWHCWWEAYGATVLVHVTQQQNASQPALQLSFRQCNWCLPDIGYISFYNTLAACDCTLSATLREITMRQNAFYLWHYSRDITVTVRPSPEMSLFIRLHHRLNGGFRCYSTHHRKEFQTITFLWIKSWLYIHLLEKFYFGDSYLATKLMLHWVGEQINVLSAALNVWNSSYAANCLMRR